MKARIPPEQRKRVLRIAGILGASGSVVLMVLAFALVLRNEQAFDETRCPFRRIGERRIDGTLRVIEESRACIDDLEERRWLVARDPSSPIELGRRRLATSFWGRGRYEWRVELEPKGKVRVEVRNAGVAPVDYREVIATGEEAPQPGGRARIAKERSDRP